MIDLAARLHAPPILVAPGVYDPLSALIAEQAGCEALFVSGAAVAMTQLGRPDFGLHSATELADIVARIVERVDVSVIVDGDQGFGNAAHLQRFVRSLCRAGASAVQIEDQVAVRSADDLTAHALAPIAEMVGRIKAAQDARLRDDFLISARTDALSSTGLDDALARGEAYVAAGCDLLFVQSVRDRAQAASIVERFGGHVPLVHHVTERDGSPFADAAAAEAGGFALALFPAAGVSAAAFGLREAYAALARDGASRSVADRSLASPDLNAIVGTAAFAQRMARYGVGA